MYTALHIAYPQWYDMSRAAVRQILCPAGKAAQATRALQAATLTHTDPLPAPAPVLPGAGTESGVRPMDSLPGPGGWPLLGNFHTYVRKENQGKMHHVQVSACFVVYTGAAWCTPQVMVYRLVCVFSL